MICNAEIYNWNGPIYKNLNIYKPLEVTLHNFSSTYAKLTEILFRR